MADSDDMTVRRDSEFVLDLPSAFGNEAHQRDLDPHPAMLALGYYDESDPADATKYTVRDRSAVTDDAVRSRWLTADTSTVVDLGDWQ